MLVPVSVIGKTGLCPSCGERIKVTPEDAEADEERRRNRQLRQKAFRGRFRDVSEDAKRQFEQAVHLYYAKHYGEALAIFDSLVKEYPGNADVESAREQCLRMMTRYALSEGSATHSPQDGAELNLETVKRVVLEKMLHGSREEIQLQAAELACRLLGVSPDGVHPRRHSEDRRRNTPQDLPGEKKDEKAGECTAGEPEQTPAAGASSGSGEEQHTEGIAEGSAVTQEPPSGNLNAFWQEPAVD
jgi:uncharacterized Zn finger protein (UPF0148 family)